jgi:SAM-dependent methyltransferase
MASPAYDERFFLELQSGSLRSAREIVPLVIELLRPSSILDVGCGNGAWLSIFAEHGIGDFHGVDGAYVKSDSLLIPKDRFSARDLNLPLDLGRSFDLVVSVEVGEHLAAEVAETFVDSLTRHAPAVLFSAAVPFQGGGHHINEQWPEYWAKWFETRGFLPVDFIRPKVWANDRVEWWYAQNILLFANQPYIDARPQLRKAFEQTNPQALCLVHPKNYLSKVVQLKPARQSEVSLALLRARTLVQKVWRRIFDF